MKMSMEDAKMLRRELQDEDGTATKPSLKQLLLHKVIFSEGALMELTRAFQSNTMLQEIKMSNCSLLDDNIAQIVDTLATSCTIHTLSLYYNKCQE